MIDRDLSEPFQIDAESTVIIRDYIAGEFSQPMLEHWANHAIAINVVLEAGWRVRLCVKIAKHRHGRELRFPVIVVENENLP